jgi:hypothetical protein
MVGGSTAFNFKSSPAARRLSSFLHAAERSPVRTAAPDPIREIRRLFTSEEIRDYLDRLENTKNITHLRTRISKWTNSTTQTTNPG